MSDFKDTNMVVQSNKLIQQTNWKLSQTQLKLFKACVSCIDTKNPPKDNRILIKKGDLVEFIENDDSKNYNQIRANLRKLITAVEIKKENGVVMDVPLIDTLKWEPDSDNVIVEFHRELMPFLTYLSSNFLQYQAGNLRALNSKYSVILYEFLLSSKRRESNRTEFYMPIEKLRNLTATTKKYDDFRNFEKKVLSPAFEDINDGQLEIVFKYEKVKRGRSIEGINFHVRFRNSHKEKSYDDLI